MATINVPTTMDGSMPSVRMATAWSLRPQERTFVLYPTPITPSAPAAPTTGQLWPRS